MVPWWRLRLAASCSSAGWQGAGQFTEAARQGVGVTVAVGVTVPAVLLQLPTSSHKLMIQQQLQWPAVLFRHVISQAGGTKKPLSCRHVKAVHDGPDCARLACQPAAMTGADGVQQPRCSNMLR